MTPEALNSVLSLLAILIPALLGALIGYLRYRVLVRRDETQRMIGMAEQANRTYELSLQERQLSIQEKNADLAALLLEVVRLDVEARLTELGKGHEVPLAAE